MNTQIIFKAEKELKDAAMKKAQSEGLTLKAILYQSLKLYTENKLKFGLIDSEPEIEIIETTPEVQKEMAEIAEILDKI